MESVIRAAIGDALKELGINEVDFSVAHPNDLAHGDYACNVAMVAAKELGQNPRHIAEQFAAALKDQIEYVEKIEVAGPGFLNFFLAREFFTGEINRIEKEGDHWGANDSLAGEVVMIEYTSPNLFKPLHVGNLVGNIIGESLTRLYEASGADVRRMNYPADIGLPVAKAVWGLKHTGGNPDDIAALGEAYRVANEAFENDEAAKEEITAINKKLYEGSDSELNALREAGIKTSKARFEELCAMLGTKFDTDIFESEAAIPGEQVVKEKIGKGEVFEESDGAIVYKGEKVGLHTRVFLNSKGLPTYEAKDIGHFMLKEKAHPDWTQSIIVTGVEQAEYFKVIFAVLKELFPHIKEKVFVHIPTGFLSLTTGKMSSRKGNVLTGESLLAEMKERALERAEESRAEDIAELGEAIAVAALKFQILRQKVGSDIVFDKEQALSFEGSSGPYLQYTHARITSLLEKAAEAGVTPDLGVRPLSPYDIERLVYRLPEVVLQATEERAPHHLVTYLIELAGAFNSFYGTEKIADVSDEFSPYKAAVAKAVQTTIRNGLWGLGIKAPERM